MTVIGWVWIVMGGLACLSSALALPAMATSMAPHDSGAVLFSALAIAQMAVGVTGLVSGIHFLKLKPWSRPALEILSWLLLALLLSSTAVPFVMVGGGPGLFLGEIIIMAVIAAMYIAPLGIMLAYLRGKKVKSAFAHSAEAIDVISSGKPPPADG